MGLTLFGVCPTESITGDPGKPISQSWLSLAQLTLRFPIQLQVCSCERGETRITRIEEAVEIISKYLK